MEELIQALHKLFPFKSPIDREVIIEVSKSDFEDFNPITHWYENQKDILPLIQNTEGIDLHEKPKFTSLTTPLGLKITLKIKE